MDDMPRGAKIGIIPIISFADVKNIKIRTKQIIKTSLGNPKVRLLLCRIHAVS